MIIEAERIAQPHDGEYREKIYDIKTARLAFFAPSSIFTIEFTRIMPIMSITISSKSSIIGSEVYFTIPTEE